jgi:hypothetical protein
MLMTRERPASGEHLHARLDLTSVLPGVYRTGFNPASMRDGGKRIYGIGLAGTGPAGQGVGVSPGVCDDVDGPDSTMKIPWTGMRLPAIQFE